MRQPAQYLVSHLTGFQVDTIDPILVAELEAIGTIRGDHAHHSARKHFAARFDPFAVKTKILAALTLIAKFDSDFVAYYQKQFGK